MRRRRYTGTLAFATPIVDTSKRAVAPPPKLDRSPDALCRHCGHRADEHRQELPSPCNVNFDPELCERRFRELFNETGCWPKALEQAFQEAGPDRCLCTGFSPVRET